VDKVDSSEDLREKDTYNKKNIENENYRADLDFSRDQDNVETPQRKEQEEKSL